MTAKLVRDARQLSLAVVTNLHVRVALSVFFAVLIWMGQDSNLEPTQVTATDSYGPEFGPLHTTDGNILETPHSLPWLLPDHKAGAISYYFEQPCRVSEIALLNTCSRSRPDRATTSYRIELIGKRARSTLHDVLPAYPEWKNHVISDTVVRQVVIHIDGYGRHGGGLCEVAFRGVPVGQAQRWRKWLWACGASLVIAFTWPLMKARTRRTPAANAVLAVCTLALVLVGLHVLRFSTGVSAFNWMGVFALEEFQTAKDTLSFFAELRIPIPPWIAGLEIASYWAIGSNNWVTYSLYKSSVLGAYLFAVLLVYPSIVRMVLVTTLSLLFIQATALVHPPNPQLYDTSYGFLLLAFLVALTFAKRLRNTTLRTCLVGVAGLSLSLWGITRPFSLYLFPLPMVFAAAWLRPWRKQELVAFALPLVLVFGGWHAQLLLRHGQLGISNHSGFNLARAWPMVPPPEMIAEHSSAPYRPLNNPDHTINSGKWQRAFIGYLLDHPAESMRMAVERLQNLADVRVDFAGLAPPPHPVLVYYRFTVKICMALVLLAAIARTSTGITAIFSREVRRRERLKVVDLVLALTTGTIVFLALGEAGEECRFVVSLLPLLALTPDFGANTAFPLERRTL